MVENNLLASIIIVSYNGRRDLERCLASLKVDDCQNYEIIVVDNASQDGSAGFVEEAFPTTRSSATPITEASDMATTWVPVVRGVNTWPFSTRIP